MEFKPEHKHRPRTDHKHHSRDDYKGKNKSERRPRKSGGHKERAMVADASDIDSSSWYSSSSSSDEEENRHKGKRLGKNINGLCFTAQGFFSMALASQAR
jgi:hypothetical protein